MDFTDENAFFRYLDGMFDTRHILAEKSGAFHDVLSRQLSISPDRVEELLKLGSIYFCEQRILTPQPLNEGDHLRIHLLPKRYETSRVDWGRRIIFETEHFLIIDKPPGIPVHATVDNVVENAISCLEQHKNQRLFVTQRLDVPTRGLLLIAKGASFQREFNRLLTKQKVTKTYRCLVENLVPTGPLIHYMEPSPRAPKVVSQTEQAGWQLCHLEILSCESVSPLFEIKIRLITGRTHQIRAQLAALGSPIVGDTQYGSRLDSNSFGLCCETLAFECPLTGAPYSFELKTQG